MRNSVKTDTRMIAEAFSGSGVALSEATEGIAILAEIFKKTPLLPSWDSVIANKSFLS